MGVCERMFLSYEAILENLLAQSVKALRVVAQASLCSQLLTVNDLVRVFMSMYVHSSFLRPTFATWNNVGPRPNIQVMSGKRAVRESGPV